MSVMSVASLPGSRTANDVHENPFASITTLTIARRTGRIFVLGARTKRMMGARLHVAEYDEVRCIRYSWRSVFDIYCYNARK